MKTDTSRKMGTNAEHRFEDIMRQNGLDILHSTQEQDMYEHWDYLVSGKFRVEVKARKKLRRHHDSVNDDVIYIEFKNVRGDLGWIYGKADCIAFERPEGFIMVRRDALAVLAETLITYKFANRPTLYKSYRRRDRQWERVGLIQYKDLLTLKHKFYK